MDETEAREGQQSRSGGPERDGAPHRRTEPVRRWEAWRSPGRMRGQIAATVAGGLLLAAVLGLVQAVADHVHVVVR